MPNLSKRAVNATAGDYPDHPILLLVPGAAGDGMDAVARLVANGWRASYVQTAHISALALFARHGSLQDLSVKSIQ